MVPCDIPFVVDLNPHWTLNDSLYIVVVSALILLSSQLNRVQNYHCRSEKPSAKQAEGSESGSMEIKGDDKKNVEDKIIAADSRRVK